MIYTYRNAPRSTVIDAERGERIPHDIFVGRATPQLFVCYGRRGDAQ